VRVLCVLVCVCVSDCESEREREKESVQAIRPYPDRDQVSQSRIGNLRSKFRKLQPSKSAMVGRLSVDPMIRQTLNG
jgi:hypothetical protein